jgi:hypothetical protein
MRADARRVLCVVRYSTNQSRTVGMQINYKF